MENLTGRQLGPYRVAAPLGEGGMAAVYKAYQAGMDRYVAVKILPQQLAKDPLFVGRFKQEAQLLAKLQHPHILPVFDFGEADGYTYIAMPFVESGTLTDLLKGRPLPLSQIRSLGAQVGDALDYAHSLGLVHRDVKPSNVLIDKRGNCLLTDFGIAKMVEGAAKFTSTGGIVGTPAYMSPEQGRGDKVDARTDIYSLGIMLYEMAVGRVPFDAETPIAIVFKHISDPLPLPSQGNRAIPDALERVILKALAKDPAERFAAAGDLVKALKAAIPETMTEAAPPPDRPTLAPRPAATSSPPPASPAAPARKRLPAWIWAAAGLGALVACAVLVVGGLAMANFIQKNGNGPASPQAAQTGPTLSAPQGAPTAPDLAATAPASPAALAVVEAGPDTYNTLNTIAAYQIKVKVSSSEDGILTVWLRRFKDSACKQPDPGADGAGQAFFNNTPLPACDQEHTLALTGAPTGAAFLGAGARLTDATGARVLAEDSAYRICFPAGAGSAGGGNAYTKTPPQIDGVIEPGEWRQAGTGHALPHGALYYLNDSDSLYLLIDVTGDTTNDPPLPQAPWGDYYDVAVDTNNNGRIDVKEDVLYGLLNGNLNYQLFLGPNTFTSSEPTASKLGAGFGASDASAAPHRFWELALSLGELRAAPGQTVHLGLTTYSQTPSFWDEIPMSYQGDFSNLIALTLGQ